MKVSVFGLGYVGVVTSGCLAKDGHQVIGVDSNLSKVSLINKGQTPIVEAGIGDIIGSVVRQGGLRATDDAREAVNGSDLSLVCVGTPSQLNGSLDLRFVRRVCEQIGAALKDKEAFHVVAIRSTLLPGSTRNIVIPTLENASERRMGTDFGLCNNPEFLREGSAVEDFSHPPKTVIGEIDRRSGDLLADLYRAIDAPLVRTDLETSEMVKYADNVWHALKVTFANEIGNICKSMGIDGHKVMDVFCRDTKLNLSASYMKPGFAFGGSCLPKDLRALTYKAQSLDLAVPVLNAIIPSNEHQIQRGLRMIRDKGNRRVGILGFSFKAGTDDLRESPIVEVVERLLGKGYEIRLYDRNVNVARLVGANRDYILNQIPHLYRLMVNSIDDVLEHGDTVVIANRDPQFETVLERLRDGQVVVDLVRVAEHITQDEKYDGICW